MPDIIGQVKNISEGGLAFRYIERDTPTRNCTEVDLFISSDEIYIEKLPFKTVNDSVRENESPFSVITIRQRGIAFGELSSVQKDLVQYIIENHVEKEN